MSRDARTNLWARDVFLAAFVHASDNTVLSHDADGKR